MYHYPATTTTIPSQSVRTIPVSSPPRARVFILPHPDTRHMTIYSFPLLTRYSPERFSVLRRPMHTPYACHVHCLLPDWCLGHEVSVAYAHATLRYAYSVLSYCCVVRTRQAMRELFTMWYDTIRHVMF